MLAGTMTTSQACTTLWLQGESSSSDPVPEYSLRALLNCPRQSQPYLQGGSQGSSDTQLGEDTACAGCPGPTLRPCRSSIL